jgi:hypothetical protein
MIADIRTIGESRLLDPTLHHAPYAIDQLQISQAQQKADMIEALGSALPSELAVLAQERRQLERLQVMSEQKPAIDGISTATDIAKTYDYFRSIGFHARTAQVSWTKVKEIIGMIRSGGDLPQDFNLNKLFRPRVTQVVD